VQESPSQERQLQCNVAISGAGLAGLAACIFLRQAGLNVVCIEPNPFPHAHVGESLDWSSPALLKALGLPRDQLIQEQIATYKRNFTITTPVGEPWVGYPHEFLKDKPFGFELVTLHVDRVQLDQRLFDKARELGTEFVWDKVSIVERQGERVTAFQTSQGTHIKARWFVDASGQARLFAKTFAIAKTDYGLPKVCLWTYFDTEPYTDGTSFFGDPSTQYLSWIWDIPITPHRTSVGFITAADNIKQQRQHNKDVKQILHEELSKFPRFAQFLVEQPDFKVFTCSYQSYVHHRVCGPNWIMVGEAASLPDALTANGVTASLRHAQEGSKLIQESFERGVFSRRQRYVYSANVRRMGRAYNHGIERAAYGWTMRLGFGPSATQKAYTAFGYLVNALYTKFRPNSRLSMMLFGMMLGFWWLWFEAWSLAGKMAFYSRNLRRGLARNRSAQAEATS